MKIDGFNEIYDGLSTREVEESLKVNGSNVIESQKKTNVFLKILGIFKEPMFLLLIIASTIYFVLGEYSDGIIMLVFVVFVSGIEFFQEWKTDKALDALKELTALKTKVIRNKEIIEIDNDCIVVGDIVLLEEGNVISADGEVLECHDLGVDESILTGESAVVFKSIEEDESLHFQLNVCYAGTMVTNGSAVIRILSVGKNTEYGKIGNSLSSISKEKTPLEKQMRKLIVICAYFSLFFFVMVILVNFFNNPTGAITTSDRIVQSILSGITVAMATIPEEIPVILTVFLAMGAWELVRKKALVRHMPAVETLGAVSVLCVDKTGTLTQNKMIVQEIYEEQSDFLETCVLACETNPYDPMEKAILEYASQKDFDVVSVFDKELVYEYSFSSESKMMGHAWKISNQNCLCVKGAYESVLPLCNLDSKKLKVIEGKILEYSRLGYRVLAVAKNCSVEIFSPDITQNDLMFVGLLAFMDPPRDGIEESLKSCYNAGIRVIMITGDNGETAKGIAAQIGLEHSNEVITGVELEAMSDDDLQERVRYVNLFARVYPNHKMRIVDALQKNKEVVAMTGDGVNYAPALKKAEIGIAMGQRGTSVAKEAADMILLDDNFNTIVDAISNGRKIYTNIKKAIAYVLVIHIPIALASLLIPMFHYPILLLPVHIVLLELIIDPTSSIIFQRIPADHDIMRKSPRSLSEPLVNKNILLRSVLQGLVIFLAVFLSFTYIVDNYSNLCLATTIAFSILILSNVFIVYVNQSDDFAFRNIFCSFKDKIIVLINVVIFIGLLAIIYIPGLQGVVNTCPLSWKELLLVFGISFVSTFWYEFVKLFQHCFQKYKSDKISKKR